MSLKRKIGEEVRVMVMVIRMVERKGVRLFYWPCTRVSSTTRFRYRVLGIEVSLSSFPRSSVLHLQQQCPNSLLCFPPDPLVYNMAQASDIKEKAEASFTSDNAEQLSPLKSTYNPSTLVSSLIHACLGPWITTVGYWKSSLSTRDRY